MPRSRSGAPSESCGSNRSQLCSWPERTISAPWSWSTCQSGLIGSFVPYFSPELKLGVEDHDVPGPRATETVRRPARTVGLIARLYALMLDLALPMAVRSLGNFSRACGLSCVFRND
jgi:hypothetical protein